MRTFQHLKQFLSGFLLLAMLIVAFTRQPAVEANQGGTEVCDDITSNTTWTSAGSPYLLVCDVSVASDVTLTVEPGVVVQGRDERRLEVQGHLEAEGTAENPITFTSELDTDIDQWQGIYFNGGTGHLNHVTVRYGGDRIDPGVIEANIRISNIPLNGEILIENSQIHLAGGYAITIEPDELHQLTLVNNDFSDTSPNRIQILGGDIVADATLAPQTGLEGYVLSGDVTVATGFTLSIDAGATIMGQDDRWLEVQGDLQAQGTATNPILFTSAINDDINQWQGIYFNGGTGHLNHVTVRYGGDRIDPGVIKANIRISNIPLNGEILIENSQMHLVDGYAITIEADELHQLTLVNNDFSDTSPNRIQILGGSIVGDTTLPPQTGLEGYVLSGDVTVVTGFTLSIDAGATIMGQYDRRLEVQGNLQALGTATNPILFTSATNNDVDQWEGIYFNGGTGYLNHVTVRYAGETLPTGGVQANIYVRNVALGGQVVIENSQVEYAGGVGLSIINDQVTITCTTFSNNIDHGLHIRSNGSPMLSISDSSFLNNIGEGLNNDNAVEIDARDLWWGDASGPSGDGPGSGDEVSGNVLYDPWLTAPPADCDDESTPTPTATSTPATNTPTPTPTGTPATNTPTGTPATNTPTGTPATNTPPPTNTPIPTSPSDFGVTAMKPNEGTTAQTTNVTITGNGFVAVPSVQLRNADGSHNLLNISHTGATQLLATVPAKLPPGLYDLFVINPDGQSAVLANAFSVLATEPEILEVRPNHGIADLPNEISLYGFSFAIGATVKLDDTELTTTRINGTQLQAVVPAGLEAGSYTVTVTNPGGQQAHLANGYTVFDNESNNDLFGYSYELWLNPTVPRAGEQVQMGLFVHRQGGRNALANVRVRFFRDSEDGTVLGDGTIPFIDPPNDVDSTIPLDVTFPEAGTFDIVAVIDPDNEVMEDTLGEMNNVISRTVTIGEPNPDQTVPVVNNILINDGALQTTEQNVSLDIYASDPNPNPSGMQAVNIIEYEYNIGASMWVPVQQSSWLPYDMTPDTYSWQLLPSAGMRYLQVRALDNASNISIGHARQLISYEPPSDSVAFRQTRVYRYEVAEGQQLEVLVEVISGDPDLYVWSSNEAESARVSNQASGNEQVIVPAEEIVPGVYQIEVYGYSDAEYRLAVTVGPPTTESAIAHHRPTNSGPKPLPSSPVVPVSSVPDEQQGVPPAAPSTVAHFLYLPAITR